MGLVSVAIEVVLLALVLSFQFSQLVRDKESALYQPVNGSSVFSV